MSEEKPHEATPGKIAKARREGNVAKSAELTTAFTFAAGAFTALALIPNFMPVITDWIRSAAYGKPFSYLVAAKVAGLSLIPMLAAGVTAALITLIQTKGPISKPIKFELNKLSPAQGFKKMFSGEGIVNALRAFFGFIIAALAIKPILVEVYSRGILTSNIMMLSIIAKDAIGRIINIIFLLGIVLGGVDFFLSLMRWKKQLRMTQDEAKRDYKENNGDPQIKGKRKQMHRQFLRGAPARVKDAAMVVTNPTHFAVALEYNPPSVPVPRILCCAADEMAFEVRKMATLYGVPIVENVQLARDLFARGKPGREIPEDAFIAVAEIVAALLKDSKDGTIKHAPAAVL